jgi:hypothetical protein
MKNVLVSCLLLAACGRPHLAANTGARYHQAFAQQRTGASDDGGPALSASDAYGVLAARRGKAPGGPGASGSGTAGSSSEQSSSSVTSTAGPWQGATGAMVLEAK